jgi:hypothetical protein
MHRTRHSAGVPSGPAAVVHSGVQSGVEIGVEADQPDIAKP